MEYNLSIDSHIGPWGYSKNYIRSQMSGFRNKPVSVRISSLGGSVDDALDIRQQFQDHGDVTCYLFGYVASAATILATGAKKTCMSKYAFYLIHKVSNWIDAWGSYNADQIQASLAKQGIAVGRIIQKFSDNTLQVNGNVPFGNSSIRFSDADSAAKISEGDWIVARVMRDPKGRPPLIQDYRKVSVNTDSIPEEFHPDLEKLICLGIKYGWELKIEVSNNQDSVTISNDAPEDGKRYTANMFQLYIGKQVRADRIKDGVYPNFVVVSAEKEAKTYLLTCSSELPAVQIGKVLKIRFPVYESLRLPGDVQMYESSGMIAMHPSTHARRDELQRAFEKAGIPGTWEISDLGRMIFSYHTGSFEVYREWEKKVRSVSGPLEDGYIFTLSAPTEGPMSIPMTTKYRSVPYYEWTLLYPDFNCLSYDSGDEQVTYYWSFECGNALLFHQKEECDTLKRPDGEKILGRILEVMRNIPPWTLPKNEK